MIFTGTSRYSTDFQSVLNRAVSIASLHLSTLEGAKTRLDGQSGALDTLQSKFDSLQSALSAIESGMGTSSFASSISTTGVVSVTVADGVTEGSYNVRVTGLGARTTTMSKGTLPKVTDPSEENIDAGPDFTLTVNGTPTSIAPASATLNSLADAINQADAGVQATVVNVGTTATPDYRLSLSSDAYDAVTVSLEAGATPLLDTMSTGSVASYTVNDVPVDTDSRNVTLAPGLTMTLQGESAVGVTTTVTVSRDASAAKNALQAFVTGYNALNEVLDTHRGQAGGALAGDALISTLTAGMRELSGFEAESGDFTNLTALGLTFDKEGKLQFDGSEFDTATQGKTAELFAFLDDFLSAANDMVESLAGETSGMIASTSETIDASLADQEKAIEAERERVDLFESTLAEQINQADALIAALEQKFNYYSNLFQSMKSASEMYS